ncbi:MAG: hypothetical protein ACKN9K_12970, partial [Dolichospermum sp.]
PILNYPELLVKNCFFYFLILDRYSRFLCYEVHHSHLPACGEGVGGGVILYLITSVSAVDTSLGDD